MSSLLSSENCSINHFPFLILSFGIETEKALLSFTTGFESPKISLGDTFLFDVLPVGFMLIRGDKGVALPSGRRAAIPPALSSSSPPSLY